MEIGRSMVDMALDDGSTPHQTKRMSRQEDHRKVVQGDLE